MAANQKPKLKTIGKITAEASNTRPTKKSASYDIAWVGGLGLRSGTYDALCITPAGKSPATSGLHLTRDAAVELASDIMIEASKAGYTSVTIQNHSGGDPQPWQTFADVEAVDVAMRIAAAAAQH